MIIQSSIGGLIKTTLLIIGVYVVLKFIGQLMIAKREKAEVDKNDKLKAAFEKELKAKRDSIGKTTVSFKSTSNKSTSSKNNVEDVDYEEVK
jgi:hypothetical protein